MFFVLIGGSAAWVNFSFAATSSNLYPVADGYYRQWTAKNNATNHYAMVDETICNGTKDFVFTYNIDSRDSYSVRLDSVPNGSVITGISVTPCASLANPAGYGSSSMNIFYRFNGADSQNGRTYTLSGATPKNLAATGFNGLYLLKNSSSTLEIGATFSGFGKKGAVLSRLAARLTWRVPTPTSTLPVTKSPTDVTAQLLCSVTGTPQVVLNWKDNTTDEDKFQIMRGSPYTYLSDGQPAVDDTAVQHLAYTSGPNITTYIDQSVYLGGSYHYAVSAINGSLTGYTYSSDLVRIAIPLTSPCTTTPTSTPSMM